MYSKFKYIYLLVLTGFSMFLYSCSQDPTSVGLGLLDNSDYITLNADSSIQTQSASNFQTTPKLSKSDRVLLGKFNNLKASMLVQFNLAALPDTTRKTLADGSTTVKSATVEMSPVYTLGQKASNFDFSVYKINSTWTQGFTADSISKLSYDASNVKTSLTATDTLYSFNLDNNAVTSWLKDSAYVHDKNYGLFFDPSANSAKIVGFQAVVTSPLKPLMKLSVVFHKSSGYEYTLSFTTLNDLHTISGTMPQIASSDLAVQGGLALSSKFQISTANLPSGAILNSAVLELTVDTLHSVLGNPASNSLVVKFITNSSTNAYDTSKTTVLNRSGNVFSGNIAPHIQRWLNGDANNGLIISLGNEENSGDLYVFQGSSQANKPRLRILYTAKKK